VAPCLTSPRLLNNLDCAVATSLDLTTSPQALSSELVQLESSNAAVQSDTRSGIFNMDQA
jgi:hypothetical protein